MNKFTKREIFLYITLCLVLLLAFAKFVCSKSLLFVYNHPETNISVLQNIYLPIKNLDHVLKKTAEYMGDGDYKIKYVYKNYYGSGFLKYNPIPNDLDSTVGVYLGQYDYDGTNSDKIANKVLSKISVLYTAFYEVLQNLPGDTIIAGLLPLETFQINSLASEADKQSFRVALSRTFNDSSSYILMLPKSPVDDDSIKVNVPFYMNSNEILIEDKKPCMLFADGIIYNNWMNDYKREFTVIFDFFIDVKNTSTGEIKRMELIPEAFLGERLQYSRRMFVPNVFVGIESINYLQNFRFMKDDDSYLVNRLYNFERYIQVFEHSLDNDLLQVKMLKRLHQSIDAFLPLLSKDEKDDYYSVVGEYLQDDNIASLNDIVNIFVLYSKITSRPNVFYYYKKSGQLDVLSKYFDENLKKLKKSGKFDIKILNQIAQAEKNAIDKMRATNSEPDYASMVEIFQSNRLVVLDLVKALYSQLIDKNDLVRIDELLKKKFTDAGYKRLRVYWIDENNIAVLNSPLIGNMSTKRFRENAVASGLPDVNYKFIDKKELDGKIYVDSLVWIRLNPSVEENKNYAKLRDTLLLDKKNYSIKTKFILK